MNADRDLYSVQDVASLLDVKEARLRYWAQTGFVGPSVRRGSRFYYTFEDLIGVKAAKELLDGGLPLSRVRKQLDALRAALPGVDRPLSRARICSDGEDLVVLTDDAAFHPKSGQVVMTFAVDSLARSGAAPRTGPAPAPAPIRPAPPIAPATAYGCFLAGVEAVDAGETARAEALFRRAVELDEHFPAAWTNLGNAFETRGARGDARAAYERALELDPDLAEARFNLANLLADVREDELALAEYRRVVAQHPDYADAHFNLALVLARIGAHAQARAHLARYLELDGDSEWAALARAIDLPEPERPR